ncbi:MAG: hypothetical protein CVU05_07370 [Bacteroidetes bacterium HGW-Bacteroidetes-21]|jgi:hypothetical protein|nr:MAG: hypothetical protein CVU05_07370 [Bacteroidetes bacterium HGW-Bacteroidetes-21]
MKKLLIVLLLSGWVLCASAQSTKQEKKVESPEPLKEIQKENVTEESIDKSFKLEEEIESPKTGEPVIGTEVYTEQEQYNYKGDSKKKKGKKKRGEAKKENF